MLTSPQSNAELMHLAHASTKRVWLPYLPQSVAQLEGAMADVRWTNDDDTPRIPLPPVTQVVVPLEDLVRQRQTVDYFDLEKPIPAQALAQVLYDATTGPYMDGIRIELYVILNRVETIPPGIYHYLRDPHALVRVNEPLPLDNARDFLWQTEVAEAAAVIAITGNMADSLKGYGNRGYRYLLMAAGATIEDIYLTVQACGLGCRPSGGWQAGEDIDLLNLPPWERVTLLWIGLGYPRRGTLPDAQSLPVDDTLS